MGLIHRSLTIRRLPVLRHRLQERFLPVRAFFGKAITENRQDRGNG
jgi:hypothetical protein